MGCSCPVGVVVYLRREIAKEMVANHTLCNRCFLPQVEKVFSYLKWIIYQFHYQFPVNSIHNPYANLDDPYQTPSLQLNSKRTLVEVDLANLPANPYL
jgi:hypothetical protein